MQKAVRMQRAVRSYETWQAERPRNAAWVAQVERALEPALGPYRRERPRDPDEARLLRRIGTPERLVGPTEAPPPRER
jgi:hypothetical protein